MDKQIGVKRNKVALNLNHFFTGIFIAVCALNLSAQEIHTAANAASLVTEADAVTGWTANNTGLANLFSDSTDPFQGSFALRIESTTGNGRFVSLPFDAVIGQVYTISVWARRGPQVFDPPAAAFANWRGFDNFIAVPIESELWTPYVFNVRANATTPQIRIYTGTAESAESAGNTIYIDALSITPAETEAPTAVTDLLASNVTETTLDLTWSGVIDNVGVTNYEIFQDGVSIGNSGINTSFSVTGLTPGSSYAFTVVAQDAALNSSTISNLVNITTATDLIPPSAVTDLAAVATGSSVTLSWSAATDNIGVADYEIFQNGQSIGFAGTALTFNVSGLSVLIDYIFTVVTLDAAGNESASSNEVSVNLFSDLIPPSTITDLAATNTTATGTQLSWSAATDNISVTNYQILGNGVSIGNAGLSTTFTVSSLLPGTSYTFTVVAEDAAGNSSAESNSVQITTVSQIHSDANAASLVNEANATLGWAGDANLTSVNDAFDGNFAIQVQSSVTGRYGSYSFSAAVGARYSIRIWARLGTMVSDPTSAAFANWRGFNGFNPVNITSTEWTAYDFILTAATANPEIRVYTGNTSTNGIAGNTIFIDAVSITQPESLPPSSVSDLSATNITGTSAQLNWTASTDNIGVTNYEIFQNDQSIGNSGTLTTFNVAGLLPGLTYNFTVIAEDAAGNRSATGNSVQVITPSEIHSDANAASIDNEANSTTGWTGNANITSVSTNPVDGNFAMQIESTATGQFASYSFNAVIGTTYYVRIWARQGAMISNPPTPAFANWQGFTGFSPQSIASTAWAPYDFFVTADSETPEIRVYTGSLATAGIVGNNVFIDAVTIGLPESEAPAAVTNLSASGTTATTSLLSWSPVTDNVGVTNYEIFRDGVSIGNSGTATIFQVSGLLPGGTYNFTVFAEDAAGNVSLVSNTAQVSTPIEVHAEANAVSVENEANSTAGWSGAAILTSVNTNPADGNFAMQIESTTTGQFASYSFDATVGVLYTIRMWARQGAMISNPPSSAFANWQGFEGFSLVPIASTEWTAYEFFVRATVLRPEIRVYTGALQTAGTVGNTVFIDGVSIQPAESIPPAAVNDLTASNTTAISTVLSWSPTTDNIGVANYEIFQNGVSIGNSGTATTFSVTGLLPGIDYDFTVFAEDAAGNVSASSNVLRVRTDGEIHSDANAASVVNEANSTSGWSGDATLTSISTDVIDGNFALQIESTPTGRYASYFFPAVVGVRYAIRIWAKQGTIVSDPPSAAIANWQDFDDFSRETIDSTTWTAYDFYVTPSTTNPEIRIYTGSAATDGVIGNIVLIDGVSITAAETEAPSVITGLIASNTTDISTDLSWNAATDNIGVTAYEIFQDGVSIGTSGTATTFSVTGLTNGTSYTFTVVARDAVGNASAPGNGIVVTTIDTEAPAAITDLSASNTTDTGTILSWSAASDNVGVTNYEVFQDGISIGNAATELTFEITGLTSGNTYLFTVISRDEAGNVSEVSNVLQLVAISDSVAPDTVTDLAATNTTATGTDLTWSAVLDNIGVTDYEIYRDGNLIGNSDSATAFTVSGLTPETTYSFTVLAVDGAANKSAVSNTVTITTLPDTTAPLAISDLTAANTTDISTVLSWSAALDDVGVVDYEIFQDGVFIGNSGTELTFTVTGLTTVTTYTFTVFSEDANGNRSEVSNAVELTTLDGEVPSAVLDLVASNVTDTSADLSWSASVDNVGVTGYQIFQNGVSIVNSITDLTFTATGLTSGLTYEFTVIAQDEAGNTSPAGNSVFVTATTDDTAPDAVTDLTVSGTTATTAVLAWSTPLDNIGVTDYEIYQDGNQIGNTGTVNSFTVSGLAPQTSYSFTIIALDGSSNPSPESNTVIAVTLEDTTPPAPISDLSATGITAVSLDLNWSAAIDDVGVTNYEIFQDGVSIGNSGLDLTFNVTGLTTLTTYTFTVVSEDANSNRSEASNVLEVITLDNIAPLAVTDLIASETTDTSTVLSWSAATDNIEVVDYDIYQDGVRIGNSAGELTYTVTGLTANSTFEFTVIAIDLAGNPSPASNSVSVTTLDDIIPPASITDLTASNITATTAYLSWSAATDNVAVVNYEIFQNGISIANVGTTLNFSVIGLTNATTYTFTVFSSDADGNLSEVSNAAVVTTLDNEAPSAIVDLEASDITDVSVNLSWSASTDNVGVASYIILQNGTSIGNSGISTSFVVTGLLPETGYEFTVVAQDAALNQSEASNAVSITTLIDNQPPSAISNLQATVITASSATLTWSAATDNLGVTNYQIFQDGSIVGNSSAATTFTVTELSPETPYNFTVIAQDAAGNTSVDGVSLIVTTSRDTEVPTAIEDLSVGTISANTIELTWSSATDNVGVVNYEIYLSGVKIWDAGLVNSYTVTGLVEATTYSFNVVAVDQAGNLSDLSNTIITTTQDLTAPIAIADLMASNVTATSVDLSWSAVTDNIGVVNYEIYSDGVRLGSSGRNLFFTVTGLTASTSYILTVVALDAAGNVSLPSNEVTVTTLDNISPTRIIDLIASNTTSSTTELSWSASVDNIGVAGYEIYQDGELIGNTSSLSYTVTGLLSGRTYTFSVLARDLAGNLSELGNIIQVNTSDSEAPSTIEDLTAVASGPSSVNLSWTAATDNLEVLLYEIYQNGLLIGNAVATTVFSVTGLSTNTEYVFTIIAVDAAGNKSETSNQVVVTILDNEAPTAVTNLTASNTTNNSTDLSWTAVSDNVGVANYEIFQNGLNIGNSGLNTTYSVTGLAPLKSYVFTVVAVDVSGNRSANGNPVFITTLEPPDTDGDGVRDDYDQCPDTPQGALVDINGCEIFNLPANAFSVSTTAATCIGSSNGTIKISALDNGLTYVVSLTDQTQFVLSSLNQFSTEVTGLAIGIYEVCIGVQGNESFKQCYTVQITEPEPLEASSFVNLDDKTVSLNMSGSKEYIVSVNGKSRVTESSEITLDLEPGMNYIEVRTELECQGTYFEQIFVSEDLQVYPNPTLDWVQVYVGGAEKIISMTLVDLKGNVLQRGSLDVPATREVALDLSQYPVGVYVIQLSGKTVNTSLKVIKH